MSRFVSKIFHEHDISLTLSNVKQLMRALRITEIDQQKVIVSISELTRNVLMHAGSPGECICELTDAGIQITVSDQGIGIKSVSEAMNGKKSPTSQGLGLGLKGVQRLMDDFHIHSSKEGGTTVIVTKWIYDQ